MLLFAAFARSHAGGAPPTTSIWTSVKFPLLLIATPPLFVGAVSLFLHASLKSLSAQNPIPDQGAMLVAYVLFMGTSFLAAVVMLFGLILLVVRSYR